MWGGPGCQHGSGGSHGTEKSEAGGGTLVLGCSGETGLRATRPKASSLGARAGLDCGRGPASEGPSGHGKEATGALDSALRRKRRHPWPRGSDPA